MIFFYGIYEFLNAPDLDLLINKRLIHRRICDRNGEVMYYLNDFKGDIAHDEKLENIPEWVINAFLTAEDYNFYNHSGIDYYAVLRAAKQNLIKRKIVSGASTLTQQLIRRIIPKKRNFREKFREMIYALKLETNLSKNEILQHYLNLVPMGGNIEGIGLASRIYFNKKPQFLSISEGAALASLPKAPGRFLPRNRKSTRRFELRRKYIINRMRKLDFITEDEKNIALSEKNIFHSFKCDLKKDHFIEMIKEKISNGEIKENVINTTIDFRLHKLLKKIIFSHRERLAKKDASQVSAVICNGKTMDLLALAGSMRYGRQDHGFVNGVFGKRSAGSVLKPFLYGAALENGMSPSRIISDVKMIYKTPKGDYHPANSSGKSYGPVLLRTGLGNSLNLTAVKILQETGLKKFYDILNKLGLISRKNLDYEEYGLGMAIGNVEITLLNLVSSYSIFYHKGNYFPVRILKDQIDKKKKIFSPETSYIIRNFLSDKTARMITFGNPFYFNFDYPVFLKTGTSTNYRDTWIAGGCDNYLTGIWAGNFDGKKTAGLSGASACGPIFKDILTELNKNKNQGKEEIPETLEFRKICGISGLKPVVSCEHISEELFPKTSPPLKACTFHNPDNDFHNISAEFSQWNREREITTSRGNYRVGSNNTENSMLQIIYPHNEDRFIIEENGKNTINFKIMTEKNYEHLLWFIDEVQVAKVISPYNLVWKLRRGRHRISVATPDKKMTSIWISVE